MDAVMGVPGDGDVDLALVDVSSMPLDQLVLSGDSVLSRSLRRVVADLDHHHEVMSAFSNFAE